MASSLVTLALVLAAVVSSTPIYRSSSKNSTIAPIVDSHRYGCINNSYIVVLKPGTQEAVMQNHFNFLAAAHQAQPLFGDSYAIKHVYAHINGYSGRFSEDSVEQLRKMPEVEFIERDQVVRTQDTQKSAPWGLARLSHRPRLTFSTFNRYEYDPAGGKGVDVYVVDTGINIKHVEFEGRAEWGLTVPENDVDEDGNGHGTHCAGTIASRQYGVAKAAKVIAIKVLGSNGSGTMADVIAGVVFAATNAVKKANAGAAGHKGSVINMSLGGGKSRALDLAVNGAVDAGVHVAVAAGNDDRNACDYSPAGAEKAITVGAATLGDERAYFSNHGKCVDVFAAGLNILSTYIGSTAATATLSGTSMASPHTAGLLAYFLSLYPSLAFDPELAVFSEPAELQHPFSLTLGSSLYAVAHAALPRWAANFLPPPACRGECARHSEDHTGAA
ncbi:Subtilisin-like serine protease pepC [Mycena venus]|uniref:Subtilisin-like serine protease pepC n=1 Tax=Mycena venus TaxID=2733690 RepID=A0A8H7CLU6_9AGAR|nr:Subtilisin-like serine protease pepC [Mycena venus]